jgi:hypothetical protein
MHAVVVRVSIGDAESSRAFLREQLVPRIAGMPGFVAGYWVQLSAEKGTSIVVFESEDAANTARENLQPPPGVTIDSVELGEVVANA